MSIDRRRGSGGYMPLRDAMNALFEGSFITPQSLGGQEGFPPVDMHLTEDDVILEMAAPGVNPGDVSISVTGDTVTISGEVRRQQQEQKSQTLIEEVWRGRFQRSFRLPIQVDANKAEAGFENGILTVTLPKSEATKPRKIQVKQQQTLDQDSSRESGGNVQSETVPIQSGSSS